jgi:hypothetical protein
MPEAPSPHKHDRGALQYNDGLPPASYPIPSQSNLILPSSNSLIEIATKSFPFHIHSTEKNQRVSTSNSECHEGETIWHIDCSMECHHESLSGNKGEHGGNQNGIRHYTTHIKRPHGSHHLCGSELDLGGLAHAEKVHQRRSSLVQTSKVPQRVRFGPSLAAA